MKDAIDYTHLKAIYDRVSRWYDFYHALVTLKSDQRGRRMVVEGAVQPRNLVLDAGSGTGSTALLAAERVGAEGRVVLFDMSEGMLASARRKLQCAGLSDRIEVRIGDILDLPFDDDSFDAVLSTYSACPLYSPEKGALELYRVLKPGGMLGVAHSTVPKIPVIRWVASKIEDVLWRFPRVTLGCRSVSIIPALRKAGASVLSEKRIGFPLWPFLVFIVRKQSQAQGTATAAK